MSKSPSTKFKTKKGAASFYIVIFTTLVLSVITLSFVRIMLNEATNTSNSDLSQSAYDSALAGIEDAKSALVKCHRSGNSDSACTFLPEQGKDPECNTISQYLYGRADNTQEVQISETSDGKEGTQSQAYTCVKINNRLSDYRVTMTTSMRIKVIPLNVEGGFDKVDSVKVSWYSSQNGTDKNIDNLQKFSEGQLYYDKTDVTGGKNDTKAPSAVSAELIQTDQSFTFDDLVSEGSNTGTDRALAVLYPVKENGQTEIKASEMLKTGNSNSTHNSFYIQCNKFAKSTEEFACNANIKVPDTKRQGTKNNETAFLVITTPYSQGDVDFAITAYNKSGEVLKFQGAQYAVDSTGRANDLYRRVETRIELGNVNFPYPEYVAQAGLGGSTENTGINKNFWVTSDNCSKTVGELIKDGQAYGIEACPTSGSV